MKKTDDGGLILSASEARILHAIVDEYSMRSKQAGDHLDGEPSAKEYVDAAFVSGVLLADMTRILGESTRCASMYRVDGDMRGYVGKRCAATVLEGEVPQFELTAMRLAGCSITLGLLKEFGIVEKEEEE